MILGFALVFLAVACDISVERSLSQKSNVIYTRYVRRKPTKLCNQKYFTEVIEVFDSKRRPPPYGLLNDQELNKFFRCDKDPSLPDCDNIATAIPRRPSTTTTRYYVPTTTTSMPWIHSRTWGFPTTTISPPIITPTTTSTTTTSTSTTTEKSMQQTSTETTTTELPLLPEIVDYNDENEYSGEEENDNEYEDEETVGEDEDNMTDENEPLDEIGNEQTNDVYDSENYTDDTSTTTTARSVFKWF